MIVIKRMDNSDLCRIAEIDRSEHINSMYVYKDGTLEAKEVDWQVSCWFTDDHPKHSVSAKIKAWKPYLEQGGIMLGAFDDSLLVGIAILRPKLTENMAQLAVLHVSRNYRGKGIGAKLTKEIFKLAVKMGAKEIYVSSSPSANTVAFYMSQGFELTKEINKELYDLEPEDIHMIKILQ